MKRAFKTSFVRNAGILSRLLLLCFLISVQFQSVSARNKAKVQKKSQIERTKSQSDNNKYRLYYLESLVQREKGNLTAQYELLKRAVELKPDAPEALFDLAENIYKGEILSDSVVSSLYQKAIALTHNENAGYLETYAKFETQLGNFEKAISVWKQLTHNEWKRETAYKMLSAIYVQQNDFEKQFELLDEWANSCGDIEEVDNQRIKALNRLERYDEEIAYIDKWIKANPDNDYYPIAKAEAFLQKNDTAAAWQAYQSAIQANPDNAYAGIFPVYYYQQTKQSGKLSSAMKSVVLDSKQPIEMRMSFAGKLLDASSKAENDSLFKQILAQPLPDKQLPELYAQYLASNNEPNSAFVPVMRKILEIEPENDRSRSVLIQDALDHRQYQQVIDLCQEGIRYNPRKLIYYQIGGGSLYQLNQYEASIQLFEKGLKYVPSNKDKEMISYFFSSFADALHRSNDAPRAYAYYDSALVYNPSNVVCLNNYAYFLALSGEQLDKALRMSELAIKIEPQNPTYIDTYAWILFVKKDYAQARAYIEDALKLVNNEPDDASLYEHAGDIYIQLGQKQEAKQSWLKAKQLGSESKTLQRKIKNMKYYPE